MTAWKRSTLTMVAIFFLVGPWRVAPVRAVESGETTPHRTVPAGSSTEATPLSPETFHGSPENDGDQPSATPANGFDFDASILDDPDDDDPSPPESDVMVLQEDARNVFYQQLNTAERNYFLKNLDEGDFELGYETYHVSSVFDFTNALQGAAAGDSTSLRIALFVALLHNAGQARVTWFSPSNGAVVSQTQPVSLSGQTLVIGSPVLFSFTLQGKTVVAAQALGQPEIHLSPAQQFTVPPTIDRVIPGF